VALDRLIRMHEAGQIRVCVDRFRAERAAIQREVENHGYSEQLGSYMRTFDGDGVDASLLTLPLYGYVEASHPRMRATLARIQKHLAQGPLVFRYRDTDDGLPPGEGAFGICSFWLVECLARAGDVEAATRAFEQLLGYANDPGLLAEEIQPGTGAALGNFPQAFSHVGLINAALTLQECAATESTDANRPGIRQPLQKASV
jgi:GH15 family glucan-1,4-alpha-glucosidase